MCVCVYGGGDCLRRRVRAEINKSGVKCRAAPSAAATAIRGESEGERERERGPCFYLSESKKMIKSRSLMRCGRCLCIKKSPQTGENRASAFLFFCVGSRAATRVY
jgi:hypothetical protein